MWTKNRSIECLAGCRWQSAFVAMLVAGLAGCWQEVEYVGEVAGTNSSPAATSPADTHTEPATEELPLFGPNDPPAVDELGTTVAADATGFGDDLANSLATASPTLPTPPDADGKLPAESNDGAEPSTETTPSATSDSIATDVAQPPATETEPIAVAGEVAAADPANPFADSTTPTTEGGQPALDAAATTASPNEEVVPPEVAPSESAAAEIAPPTTDTANLTLPSKTPAAETTPDAAAVTPVPGDVAAADAASNSLRPTPTSVRETTAPNTRLNTWRLGSKLSLAALANDRGLAAENVLAGMTYCRQLADELGTSVAELPERGLATSSSRPASRQVLNYLLFVQGQQIGRELTSRYGAEHAALFEVATKSNLLLVLYTPGASASTAISEAITQAAPRAQLPAALWQPLLDLVAAQADAAQVRQAVRRFHADVEAYLAKPQATP